MDRMEQISTLTVGAVTVDAMLHHALRVRTAKANA
jgi:hypothetical protein